MLDTDILKSNNSDCYNCNSDYYSWRIENLQNANEYSKAIQSWYMDIQRYLSEQANLRKTKVTLFFIPSYLKWFPSNGCFSDNRLFHKLVRRNWKHSKQEIISMLLDEGFCVNNNMKDFYKSKGQTPKSERQLSWAASSCKITIDFSKEVVGDHKAKHDEYFRKARERYEAELQEREKTREEAQITIMNGDTVSSLRAPDFVEKEDLKDSFENSTKEITQKIDELIEALKEINNEDL